MNSCPQNQFWEECSPIPPVAHFIWLGGPLPRFVNEFFNRFCELHTDWDVILHRSIPLDLPARWYEHLLTLKSHAARTDWVRLWIIHKCGGFYLDTDLWAFRSFSELRHYRFLALGTGNGWANNAMFAEAANGPGINELLRRLEHHTFDLGNPFIVEGKSGWKWSKFYNAGPAIFTMAALERPDIIHLSQPHWFQCEYKPERRIELVRARDEELPALFNKYVKMPDGVWPFGLHCGSESERLAFPDPMSSSSPRALEIATAILTRLLPIRPVNCVVVGDIDGVLSAELLAHAPLLRLIVVLHGNESTFRLATDFASDRTVVLSNTEALADTSTEMIFVCPESACDPHDRIESLWSKLKVGGYLGGVGSIQDGQRIADALGSVIQRGDGNSWFLQKCDPQP